MVDFLQNYWQYIIAVLSFISIILNIIFLLVKKVPLTKILKVVSLLPSLVSNAEKVFPLSNEGEHKKELVKSLFNDLLFAYGCDRYAKYIDVDNLIEEVLKCPTKKFI